MSLTDLKYAKDEIAQLKQRIAEKNQNLDAYRSEVGEMDGRLSLVEGLFEEACKLIEIGIWSIEGETLGGGNKDSIAMREFLAKSARLLGDK